MYLRAALCTAFDIQCPSDIVDQIGGWTTDGVGQGYGAGYPIEVLDSWVTKVVM